MRSGKLHILLTLLILTSATGGCYYGPGNGGYGNSYYQLWSGGNSCGNLPNSNSMGLPAATSVFSNGPPLNACNYLPQPCSN